MSETTPEFVPGMQLSEKFYEQAVLPLLNEAFPRLPYSAGLIDDGSEVFGLDTPRSTDHHWGPRVLIFLSQDDLQQHEKAISECLANHLPYDILGYPTNFSEPDPRDQGVQRMERTHTGPVRHRVEIMTVRSFCDRFLGGIDPEATLTVQDWKRIHMQRLYGLRKGRLFRDDLGIENLRQRLRFYPRDLMLSLLLGHWWIIEQEEAFVGRCGEMGDEFGSRLIASRIVDALMKITFLLEGEYYPYSKWIGTAFKQLASCKALMPHFEGALSAADWHEREQHLSEAYIKVIALQNSVEGMPHVEARVSPFFGRPFMVPHADRILTALRSAVEDKSVMS